MNAFFQLKNFVRSGVLSVLAAAVALTLSYSAPVQAQQGQGILGGAIIGGAIGGAVKGKKGVLPGAIIGGVVGGAAANSRARQAPPPPPRYYQPAPRPPVYQNSLVYNIQASLTRLGYNPGPVDGVYGQRTADAISAYEYNNQLPVTGQASNNVYYHMKQSGG